MKTIESPPRPLPAIEASPRAAPQPIETATPLNPSARVSFRLSLPCELRVVRQAAAAARNFMTSHAIPAEDLMGCELALVEACNNAILYATEAGRQKPFEIELLSDGPRLELHVIDHTPGFEWPAKLDLPRPDQERSRGLFIIQSVMDETLYLRGSGENRLVMRKTFARLDHA